MSIESVRQTPLVDWRLNVQLTVVKVVEEALRHGEVKFQHFATELFFWRSLIR